MSRVLVITQKLTLGGAPKRLIMLSDILNKNRYKIFIASPGGELFNSREDISFIKMEQTNNPIKKIYLYVLNIILLNKIIKNSDVDILLCNTRYYFFMCKLLTIRNELKYYNIIQGTPTKIPLLKFFHGEKILSVSNAVTNYLINDVGISKQKIITVKNTVPKLRKYSSKEVLESRRKFNLDKYFILSCIGRYDEVKGHKYLLTAFKKIVQSGLSKDFKLILMGFGDLESEIVNIIEKNNLEEDVLMLPKHSNVEEVINITDIAILPSLREGLSTFLLEVMSIGKPIIASDIPGNDELIDHDINGILVPPRCSDSITKAVIDLVNSKSKREKYSKNSLIKYYNEYSFEKYSKDIERFFNQ